MKKVLFLVFSLFAFVFICSAKESWEWKKFELSEDIDISDAVYIQEKGGFTGFIAKGKEYDCLYEDYESETDTTTCNIYKISLDGKVTKANMYGTSLKNIIRYTAVLNESSNQLFIHYDVIKGYDAPRHRPVIGVVAPEIKDDEKYVYLKCIYYENETVDMCEIGIEKNDQTIYGIINSKGNYIIEPNAKYSLAYENNDDHPNFAALKDADGNTYIVGPNGKVEVITNEFKEAYGFLPQQLLNYDDSTNYYSFYGTPALTNTNAPQYNIYKVIFTKDKVLKMWSDEERFNTTIEFINEKPYFVDVIDDTIGEGYIEEENVYSLEDKLLLSNITLPEFGNDLLIYSKDGEVFATDMANLSFSKKIQGERILRVVTSDGHSIYLLATYDLIPGNTTNYYLITLSNEEPDPEPTPTPDPSKTPKYSCQKAENFFWDKDGNKVTKEEYEKLCPEKVPDTGFVIPVVSVITLAGGSIVFKKKKLLNRI